MWSVALMGRLALSPTGLTLAAKKIWLAQFQCDRQKIHPITLQVFFFLKPIPSDLTGCTSVSSEPKSGWNYSKQGITLKKFSCFVLRNSCGTQNNGLASRCVWGNPYSAQTEDFSQSKHPTWFQRSLVRKPLRWDEYKHWFMLLAQTHTLNVWLDESYVPLT